MNYTFLSSLTLAVCMHIADAKAGKTNEAVAASKPSDAVAVPKQSDTASAALKIGYVDYEYIMEHLPEAKKNNADIQSFGKQLQNQIQEKAKELQEKGEAAQQQLDSLTDAQKKQKYAEFYRLQAAIQELQEESYMKMQQKTQEVMQPLYDRIQSVIKQIATEQGYTFVLNKSISTQTSPVPVVCFAPKAFDISSLVVEKCKAMAPEAVKSSAIGPQNNPTTTKEPTKRPATKSSAKGKK